MNCRDLGHPPIHGPLCLMKRSRGQSTLEPAWKPCPRIRPFYLWRIFILACGLFKRAAIRFRNFGKRSTSRIEVPRSSCVQLACGAGYQVVLNSIIHICLFAQPFFAAVCPLAILLPPAEVQEPSSHFPSARHAASCPATIRHRLERDGPDQAWPSAHPWISPSATQRRNKPHNPSDGVAERVKAPLAACCSQFLSALTLSPSPWARTPHSPLSGQSQGLG